MGTTKVELPPFMPMCGLVSVVHKKARVADVCSTNQLSVFLRYGWERGCIEDLMEETDG